MVLLVNNVINESIVRSELRIAVKSGNSDLNLLFPHNLRAVLSSVLKTDVDEAALVRILTSEFPLHKCWFIYMFFVHRMTAVDIAKLYTDGTNASDVAKRINSALFDLITCYNGGTLSSHSITPSRCTMLPYPQNVWLCTYGTLSSAFEMNVSKISTFMRAYRCKETHKSCDAFYTFFKNGARSKEVKDLRSFKSEVSANNAVIQLLSDFRKFADDPTLDVLSSACGGPLPESIVEASYVSENNVCDVLRKSAVALHVKVSDLSDFENLLEGGNVVESIDFTKSGVDPVMAIVSSLDCKALVGIDGGLSSLMKCFSDDVISGLLVRFENEGYSTFSGTGDTISSEVYQVFKHLKKKYTDDQLHVLCEYLMM